jgi:hypothetical protein
LQVFCQVQGYIEKTVEFLQKVSSSFGAIVL